MMRTTSETKAVGGQSPDGCLSPSRVFLAPPRPLQLSPFHSKRSIDCSLLSLQIRYEVNLHGTSRGADVLRKQRRVETKSQNATETFSGNSPGSLSEVDACQSRIAHPMHVIRSYNSACLEAEALYLR